MRVMVLMKANPEYEAGAMPKEADLAAMGEYNAELVKAGILRGGEGLQPSKRGKRVRFRAKKPKVIDGPFAETKELLAGFWIWEVATMEEAVDWAERCPVLGGEEMELELRPVSEADDYGEEFTPELREQEENMRRAISEEDRG